MFPEAKDSKALRYLLLNKPSDRAKIEYHAAFILQNFAPENTTESLFRKKRVDPKRRWIYREHYRQLRQMKNTEARKKNGVSKGYTFILPSSLKPKTAISIDDHDIKNSSGQKNCENKENTRRKTLCSNKTDPVTCLHNILKHETGMSIKPQAALELQNFFLVMTDDNISAYNSDVLAAVRKQNIEKLSQIKENGGSTKLQCCNRFGESILHKACRYGATSVVHFLVKEAKISVRVRDDYGRTPLHDAFWTPKPEFELVKVLIETCPDLLLMKDVRGFTPLSYTRKEHWGIWCQFLQANRNILTPTILASKKQ